MPRAKHGRPVVRQFHIYVLVNPKTEAVFYVGLTDDPYRRLLQHKKHGGHATTKPVKQYIERLRASGIDFEMRLHRQVKPGQCAHTVEASIIRKFAALYPNDICNRTHQDCGAIRQIAAKVLRRMANEEAA